MMSSSWSTNQRTAAQCVGALLVAACLSPAVARAADCAAPYAVEKLLSDLLAAESALKADQGGQAKEVATRMEAGLACLDTALPKQMIGRAYRAIGAGMYAGGEESRGNAWLRSAAESEPTYDYGIGELPEESPVRFAFMDAKGVSADTVPVEGKAFIDGTFKIDGSSASSPEAKPGRPHLLQKIDGSVMSWVIEGPDFPAEVLADKETEVAVVETPVKEGKQPKVKAPKPEKEPKVASSKDPKPDKEPKVASDKPEKEPKVTKVVSTADGEIKRTRPKEKTPLMIAGGVVMVAGGGLYYMAGQKRGDFDASNDMVEVDKLQGQVNRLVIASAAVAAVGAGTLTWGIILDGGTPMPTVNFRF